MAKKEQDTINTTGSLLYQGNHSDLLQVVQKVYRVRKPLNVLGTFGIGKSVGVAEAAKCIAKDLNLEYSAADRNAKTFADLNNPKKFCFLPIILHHLEPGDMKGLPYPDEKRERTIYLPLKMLPETGSGIIFFDEYNLAPHMVLNNMYQLIEEGKVGEYILPKGYLCIAAGNLADDRGNTFDVPMPLNNRFLHFQLNCPTVEDWTKDYAIPRGVDHRIINYLHYDRSKLHAFKPDSTVEQIAVGSPRMWADKVSDIIKDIPTDNERDLEMYLALGVGTATARSMVAWLKLSKKYDIEAIFRGEEFDVPGQDNIDVLYSLISACVSYYIEALNSAKDKAVTGKDSAKMNNLAVAITKLSTKFKKEHQILMMSQVKAMDPLLLQRIAAIDKDLQIKFSKSIFAFLI